ncbi:MAG: 4-(cytidine 5'-diphospho)-2-C-methyl-D-erythritol kinase, partial [Phycisphaerales bacterium]
SHKEQFEAAGDGLLVRAPAKINLSLLVAGKRPDGFHELETIMAKINWYDEILIETGQKEGIELVCAGLEWAPEGEENLVYKAAEMLLESKGESANVRITLNKNIPAGTGLGSASSDAAATLLGLDKYLSLKIPNKRLAEMAVELGSDVAFFLDGPQAFCTGKGEKIKKFENIFNFLAILVLPDLTVSTKKVYANYEHNQTLYEQLSAQINSHIRKNNIDLVARMCANMLDVSSYGLVGGLAELKTKIESLGFGPAA